MMRAKSILDGGNTIIIKVGTNLLADKEQGISLGRIEGLAHNVASLKALGKHVALVSSGAIGAGVAALGLKARPKSIPEKQATAAIGQPLLMEAYVHAFRKQQCNVAQILLTKDDFINRSRYVNAKNTFSVLFEQGIIPIVNENDTVAIEEIKLGDNDNLSALVANLVEADLLIILSDINGLYSDDPTRNPNAELIPIVEKITPAIERIAKSSKSELSTGGMITKIQAAQRCVSAGIAMLIANGQNPGILQEIADGIFQGTLFLPSNKKINVRKKWIGFVSHSKGHVVVDDGARQALIKKKKSLLPSGIIDVHGEFKAHDTISVYDIHGNEIARGVTTFNTSELNRIKGKKTVEAEHLIQRKISGEVIHRDNLVIMGDEEC